MARVAIILPSYNEEKRIALILRKLNEFRNRKKLNFIVIVIDDGSSDATYKTAASHADFILKHQINLGKGAALKTACDFAFNFLDMDYVIFMDADGQHSVNDLPLFLEKIESNIKLILGIRSFYGMPRIAVMINRFASYLLYGLTGVFIPDIPSGYKAFSREIYDSFEWKSDGYEIELEMALFVARNRLFFATVPIKTIYPTHVKGTNPILDGAKIILKILGVK